MGYLGIWYCSSPRWSPESCLPADGIVIRVLLEMASMSDTPEEEGTEGDVDHGLGDVEALFVISHGLCQRIIQPKVRSTTHRRARTWKPGVPSIWRTASMTKSRKAALSMSVVRS